LSYIVRLVDICRALHIYLTSQVYVYDMRISVMALTAAGWELVINWVDRAGNNARNIISLVATDDAGDADAVFGSVTSVLAALNAGSDAVVASYLVQKRYVEDTLVLPSTAEAEMKAHISAKIAGDPSDSAVFDLPAPADAMFVDTTGPNANIVNVDEDPALSIVAMFSPAGVAFISDGEHWDVNTAKGKRIHKHSTRG